MDNKSPLSGVPGTAVLAATPAADRCPMSGSIPSSASASACATTANPNPNPTANAAPAPRPGRRTPTLTPGTTGTDGIGGRATDEAIAIGLSDRTPWLAMVAAAPAAGMPRPAATQAGKDAGKRLQVPRARHCEGQHCCDEFGNCACGRCKKNGRRA